MWVYISTVTRCARLAADVGWPEPAAVVISSANLIRSIALACTEATKAIVSPPCLPGRGCGRSGYLLEGTRHQAPGQIKLIGVHRHWFGSGQGSSLIDLLC